ncbi:MAG: hypothetical protein ACK4OJ_04205 [Brevundimonas sp.]
MTALKERPILFSGPMVRALLDGRKTQTRRVVKLDVPTDADEVFFWSGEDLRRKGWRNVSEPGLWARRNGRDGYIQRAGPCPYGVPGDRLWVKETWRPTAAVQPWDLDVAYHADGAVRTIKDGDFGDRDWTMPKAAARGNVSPLFMPRWASRLTFEITEVRVERLADISRADAIAEGATLQPIGVAPGGGWSMDWSRVGAHGWNGDPVTARDIALGDPQMAFANFINELHGGPRWNFYYNGDGRYPEPIFDANPWVWALTLRELERA